MAFLEEQQRHGEALFGALDVNRAAQHLGVSVSYLNRLRSAGGGPPFIKLGSRVTYRRADLDAWQDEHVRKSTSETNAA